MPYELKVTDNEDIVKVTLGNVSDLQFAPDFKLILRPLSDLGQGKKHLLYLRRLENNDMLLWALKTEVNFLEYYNEELTYSVMQYLTENHFDVFGLIDAGLAIDINTLKNL